MIHSEELEPLLSEEQWSAIRNLLGAGKHDAQVIITGPEDDIHTALETIEERCQLALEGIPNETRKSLVDGTTIFERVLPGADRMYPDTDSAPIPLEDDYIQSLKQNLPEDIIKRYRKLKAWNIPEDTYTYIFSKDHFPLIEKIINELEIDPKLVGTFFGHSLKHAEGQYTPADTLYGKKIYKMFAFLKKEKLDLQLAKKMLPIMLEYPKMDFGSILNELNFKRVKPDDIVLEIPILLDKFKADGSPENETNKNNWVMGQLRNLALGNMNLAELSKKI
jgi:glutamyl-tRNA(Gln) amidotransferase subunit E